VPIAYLTPEPVDVLSKVDDTSIIRVIERLNALLAGANNEFLVVIDIARVEKKSKIRIVTTRFDILLRILDVFENEVRIPSEMPHVRWRVEIFLSLSP
jgi:hypothetical protein